MPPFTENILTIYVMNKTAFLNILENVFPPAVNQALNDWFLKGVQSAGEVTLVAETTYVVPFNSDNKFAKLVLGSANLTDFTCTIGDLKEGDEVMLQITQDGTGARTINWGTTWESAGGTDPTVTASTDAVDIFKGIVHGTKILITDLIQAIATLS